MRQKVNFSSLPPKVKKIVKWHFISFFFEFVLMITGAVLIESQSAAGDYILIFAVVAFVVTIVSMSIITRKYRRKS